MINEFMPDMTTIDIREDSDTFYQTVILVEGDQPYQYELTCDYVTKTNKVHWIVFKNDLWRYHGRYRVSLFNYPVSSMEEAIEKSFACVENHYMLNHRA